MKFTINYTVGDYYEAQKLFNRANKKTWLVQLLIPIVGLFLVGVSIISLVRGNPIETRDYMFFILGAFYLSFPFWFYKVLIKRMYKKSKFLHVPSEVEITSEQVSMTNELNSGIIKWPLFIKSAYNDKTLILMSTPRTMLIIPKRFVPTEAEWNELLQIVKEKVVVS